MKLENPLHLDDKNAVFYSSLHLLDEQIKYNKCEMRKISDLISKFFNDEKVAEIEWIIGSSKITFDLKIVWKQLQVHLIVLVNKFGKAVFNFFIPNQRGFDKLVFENEDLPSIERLLNFLNIKKTGSAATIFFKSQEF